MSSTSPIEKKILYTGQKYVPLSDGCKVHFHFQTWKLEPERVLLDDSRKIGKKEPMVLILGHKFKLEVWESIVKKMAVGEVSSFRVNKDLVFSYPFVSKTLRDIGKDPSTVRKHACTMTLQTEGIGYKDLDELMLKPTDLEFIIEILKVELPSEFEKEDWLLNADEKLSELPSLRTRGNKLYGEKKYKEAQEMYARALDICEELIIKEKPNDEDWIELQKIKMPILLNFAQCRLVDGDYYAVIEHCNTVLQFQPDNDKALYKRAKAHVGAWNPDSAEADYRQLKKLSPSMIAYVDRELAYIQTMRREKATQDKESLKNLFKNVTIES